VLQNADQGTLTVHQIAQHLGTRPDNITYELNLGKKGHPGRLVGQKVQGPGVRGRNGQWRIDRTVYLDWLGVPGEDRDALGPDGLPRLYTEREAATELDLPINAIRIALVIHRRVPYIATGRQRYLTHHQLERLRVLLAEDCREKTR
jgi:hypothetical protein